LQTTDSSVATSVHNGLQFAPRALEGGNHPIEQAGEAGGPATVIDYRGSYEDYLASAHAVLAAA
jgi:hypothetical protein